VVCSHTVIQVFVNDIFEHGLHNGFNCFCELRCIKITADKATVLKKCATAVLMALSMAILGVDTTKAGGTIDKGAWLAGIEELLNGSLAYALHVCGVHN
jgi:hypothetical protein